MTTTPTTAPRFRRFLQPHGPPRPRDPIDKMTPTEKLAQAVLVGNRQCGAFYTQLLKIKHSFKVTPISKALFHIIKERVKEVDSMSRQFKTMHAMGHRRAEPRHVQAHVAAVGEAHEQGEARDAAGEDVPGIARRAPDGPRVTDLRSAGPGRLTAGMPRLQTGVEALF